MRSVRAANPTSASEDLASRNGSRALFEVRPMIAKLKAALKRRNRPDGWWIDSPALDRHDNRQMGFFLRADQLDALVACAEAAKYVRDNLGKTNVAMADGTIRGATYDVMRAWGELNDPVNRLELSW